MFRFMLWLVPAIGKFPRSQKFLLGDRLQTTALDVLELLIEATYTCNRGSILSQAHLGLEKFRAMVRLAMALKHFARQRYEYAARSIDDAGRLVGGWRKANDAAAEG